MSEAEADSVVCVNGGQSWVNGQCQAPCDSTKWTCHIHGTFTNYHSKRQCNLASMVIASVVSTANI